MPEDVAIDADDRFADLLALYWEAWESGRDAPTDTPADAETYAEQLKEQRQFFEQVRRLRPPVPVPKPPRDGLPETIGKFRVLRLLGQGSFGIVFLAHDPILKRDVALKVPRTEVLLTPELRRRFLREARAASSLDHPNLVPVYEAGEAGALCWIASAFIDGPTLAAWVEAQPKPIPISIAVEFIAELADGLHHSHRRGVWHCDVKPGNVLLANGDVGFTGGMTAPARLVPKLTDFGLARLSDTDDDLTRTGQLLGTPRYMSPEQAAGRRKDLGPQTDIWALGVMLYELLAGVPPFDGERLALLQAVQLAEAPSLRATRRAISRDLEAVCLKCLEKEPAKRYASAAELAMDLRLVLVGEPPQQARPAPVWRKPVRWVRGRMLWIALAAAVTVASVAIGVALWPAKPHPAPQEPLRKNDVYAPFVMPKAGELWHKDQIASLWEELARHRTGTDMADARGFEWYYLWHQASRERLIRVFGTSSPGKEVMVTRDSKELLTLGEDCRVRRWSLASGQLVWTSPEFDSGSPFQAALSADGLRVVIMEHNRPNALVRVFDIATGEKLMQHPVRSIQKRSRNLAISADGRWVAFGGDNRPTSADGSAEAHLWDHKSGRAERIWTGRRLVALRFSPDDTQLLIAGELSGEPLPQQIKRLTLGPVSSLKTTHAQLVDSFAAALTVLPNSQGHIFCLESGVGIIDRFGKQEEVFRLPEPGLEAQRIVFDPQCDAFACCARENVEREPPLQWLSIWDAATFKPRRTPWKADFSVEGMAFAPDGRGLVVGSKEGLRYISVAEIPESETIEKIGYISARAVAYSPDGGRLATCGEGGLTMRLFDPVSGKAQPGPVTIGALVNHVAWSPAGDFLVSAGYDRNVGVWNADGTQRHTLTGHTDRVRCVAVSPDGKTIASGAKDKTLRLWNRETGKSIGKPIKHPEDVNALVFTHDGERVVAVTDDGKLWLWDWKSSEQLDMKNGYPEIRDERFSLLCVALSPDGTALATGGRDRPTKLWTIENDRFVPKHALATNEETRAVAFSPDGRTLATGGTGKIVRFWEASTGLELLALKPVSAQINSLAFSRDGERLSAALHDGTIRTWYAPKVENPSPFGP